MKLRVSSKHFILVLMAVFILGMLVYGVLLLSTAPDNNRNWSIDQSRLAKAQLDGQLVHIKNVRNFQYESAGIFTPVWEDRQYNLDLIKKVYFIIEPLSSWQGVAHTFLSFEFKGEDDPATSQFVSVSVEVRKEEGERFSPFLGLLRQFELMYVIADERDVIKLRANHRKHELYIYPANMPSKQAMQELFVSIMTRANQLHDAPEYYHTIVNNCTTNIVRHINEQFPGYVPWSYKILLPGYSDELAFELGMIDTNKSFERMRLYYRLDDNALNQAGEKTFSIDIRKHDPL
ncbi:MAG: DUF4105 domain-containing protein [Gammaproteobacteria bacterium]|nr:DUF4105 domain-containing protein [Gammaproteobacteria bacterium]